MTNDVTYIDAFATFVDTHKLEATTKAGATTEYTADHFVVCTGGRPRYLDIPGAKEHCITPDDLSPAAPPGKTLSSARRTSRGVRWVPPRPRVRDDGARAVGATPRI